MDFVTVGQLRTDSAKVWGKIAAGEEIVLTRNGKPFAIIAPTQPSEVESNLRALRAAGFGAALSEMQRHAAKTGLSKMTLKEINAEISAARKENRDRAASGR